MNKAKIIKTVVMLIILVVVFFLISRSISKHTGYVVSEGYNEESRKCLRDKGVILYVNSVDFIETLDKLKTRDYLSDVEVFNCLVNKLKCLNREIYEFPTWDINGKMIVGDISVYDLLKESGC